MIPEGFPRAVIPVGTIRIIRSGKPTEKSPEGTFSEFPMVWRAVPDSGDGLPGIVAQGASMGTIFQLHLTGANIDRMLREVERVVDEERGKSNAKWGTAG